MNEHRYQVASQHLQLPSGNLAGAMELAYLQLDALRKQLEASRAWETLMRAHERHGSSWAAVLRSALAAGLTSEQLKEILAASPSTYSRWVSGVVQPSAMLRARLAPEVFEGVAAAARENEDLIGERERQASPGATFSVTVPGELVLQPPSGSAWREFHVSLEKFPASHPAPAPLRAVEAKPSTALPAAAPAVSRGRS